MSWLNALSLEEEEFGDCLDKLTVPRALVADATNSEPDVGVFSSSRSLRSLWLRLEEFGFWVASRRF